jgi:oligogalacturonide lyase
VVVLVALLAAGLLRQPQEALPNDWIDADTGHRVVRLTGDAGGSTLYFHDNAFSPEGDRLIVNTPDGIAMIDVAKIGTAEARVAVIAPRARGGYFARRTREIYFNDMARGAIVALNVDTKAARDVPRGPAPLVQPRYWCSLHVSYCGR